MSGQSGLKLSFVKSKNKKYVKRNCYFKIKTYKTKFKFKILVFTYFNNSSSPSEHQNRQGMHEIPQ